MDTVTIDRAISVTVREFCALTGLGVTKTYELLGTGELDSIKVGKRRLVLMDSYRRMVDRQLAAQRPSEAA